MALSAFRFLRTASLTSALAIAGCGGSDGDGVPPSSALLITGTQVAVGAGAEPSAVASGDFNHDGRLDLAVASRTDDAVIVFLGSGNGSFGAGTTFSTGVGGEPSAVFAADVNADGHLDLVVANSLTDDVVLLTGNGTGSFSLATSVLLAAGADATGIVAADLNADGLVDLAVVGAGNDEVTVALATGPGTFGGTTTFSLGAGFDASAIVAADFDEDGLIDLVATSSANGSVAVLLGAGGGAFGVATTLIVDAATDLSAVAVGDLDADGDLDLAVANRTTGEVSVLLGDGNGGFAAAVDYTVGVGASAVAIADFNLDGRLDLVVAVENSSDVKLLLGNGDGTFAAALTFGIGGTAPTAFVIGDFNGNGSLDVATANSTSASVSILLGAGHATTLGFTAGSTVVLGAAFDPQGVVTADFDGDGHLDIATANTGDNSVSIALGTGFGTFAAAVETSLGAGTGPVAIATADVDGNGTLDLVVANGANNSASILLGTGTGTFALSGSIALAIGAQPSAVVLGDFDEDGLVDVVVANSLLGNVSIALGTGGGLFGAAVNVALGVGFGATAMCAGDFDHDGNLDIAASSGVAGTIAILLGDGTGGFAAATIVIVDAGSELSDIACADLNRDGDLDLVVTNTTTGQVSVVLGNGNGTFGAAVDFAVGADASSIVVADFNRDGRLDLGVTLEATGRFRVLLGNGNGTFSGASDFSAGGTGSASLSVADLDHDGRLDVVVANRTTGNVGVLLGS